MSDADTMPTMNTKAEHSAMTRHELQNWFRREWPYCGCGDQDGIYALLTECLGLFAQGNAGGVLEKLGIVLGGEPADPTRDLLAEHFLKTMDDAGLIDHGTSIYGSFITPLGERVLAALREHGPGFWSDDD